MNTDRRDGGMTLDRFRRIVAAYGADPVRWPPEERALATAFMAQTAAAHDLLAEARDLDRALDDLVAEVPEPAMARLAAATAFPPPQATSSRGDRWRPDLRAALGLALWPRAAALASMAVLGIVVGLAVQPEPFNGDDVTLALTGLTGASVEEFLP